MKHSNIGIAALIGAAGVIGVMGVSPAAASAPLAGHQAIASVPSLPGSRLTLAQAPSGLRMAVHRTLGAPAHQATSTTQQAELAESGVPGDYFGDSVAISGSTAVVGADGNSRTGAAYVFTGSGGSWTQVAKLTASGAAAGDRFGYSVAMSGSTIVVGAAYKNSETGAAYVFTGSGGSWTQVAKLTASDAAAGDYFGVSVATSGPTVVVGASEKNLKAGAAYVFTEPSGGWVNETQQAELTASDATVNDYFGASVAISGSTAVIGAADKHNGTGAAYVFTKPASGWKTETQQAELTTSGSEGFGSSVAISGSTAVIGADEQSLGTGAAYVFTGMGSSWTQAAELTASDGAEDDYFGLSVAISGATAIVGAEGHNSTTGAAYAYTGL